MIELARKYRRYGLRPMASILLEANWQIHDKCS